MAITVEYANQAGSPQWRRALRMRQPTRLPVTVS